MTDGDIVTYVFFIYLPQTMQVAGKKEKTNDAEARNWRADVRLWDKETCGVDGSKLL